MSAGPEPGAATERSGLRGWQPPLAHLGRGRSGRIVRILRDQTAVILLVVLILTGGLLSDVFLTPRNMLNIVWAVSVLGIVALGQTMLLITCNFDMSVAFVIGLAGIVTVSAQTAGLDLPTSIALGLLAGMAIGFLNGYLVVKTGANPFLITLGTGYLVYSLSLIITQSKTLNASIPEFNFLGRGQLFGFLHVSVILFLVLAFSLEFVLRRTTFGRSLYVLGLNETAGRLSGLVMTARTNSTVALAGAGMEFDSIIAAVLGGTSLFGGRGGALRTVVGVVVLGVLNNLLILLDVPIESQAIAKGAVFLFVVWADSVLRRP